MLKNTEVKKFVFVYKGLAVNISLNESKSELVYYIVPENGSLGEIVYYGSAEEGFKECAERLMRYIDMYEKEGTNEGAKMLMEVSRET